LQDDQQRVRARIRQQVFQLGQLGPELVDAFEAVILLQALRVGGVDVIQADPA